MVQLDGLRFVAVFFVMFGHWVNPPALEKVNWYLASSGVNLFFVLSGFLITGILLEGSNLKTFYIRRFLRIFPLYYFVIFLGVIFYVPFARGDFYWLISYTVNVKSAFNKGYVAEFSHLWSLAVEEQFYIIFPFLMFIKRHLLKVFISLVVIAVACRVLSMSFGEYSRWFSYALTPCCFDCFGVGAVLAYMRKYKPVELKRILRLNYVFISMLALSAAVFFTVDELILPRLLFSIFAFWLIGKASYRRFNGWLLENKLVVYLGKITYGLYIYHYFMPYIFEQVGIKGMQYAPLYFITTVAVASISWYMFERPINNLKRFFNYGKPSTRPATSYSLSSSGEHHQS